jgi:hypothetical protein
MEANIERVLTLGWKIGRTPTYVPTEVPTEVPEVMVMLDARTVLMKQDSIQSSCHSSHRAVNDRDLLIPFKQHTDPFNSNCGWNWSCRS